MWKQNARFKNRCLLAVGALSVSMVMVGCGGDSHSMSNPSPTPSSGSLPTPTPTPTPTPGIPQNSGRARLLIDWPALAAGSSTIPSSITGSLVSSTGTVVVPPFTRNRPSAVSAVTETVDFSEEIPPGTYVFSFESYSLQDGQGSRIAAGSLNVTITTGETTGIQVALTATPRAYSISLTHDVIRVGEIIPLVLQGWLANGNTLNVPPSQVQWSLVSGSEAALLVPSGDAGETAIKGIAPGTVKLQARESGNIVERFVQVVDVAGLKIRGSEADSVLHSDVRVQLAAVYQDVSGNLSSYSTGSLVWSLVSGQSFATIDPVTGLLTPLGGEGIVRVRVTDTRFGFATEQEYTIQAYGNGVEVNVR